MNKYTLTKEADRDLSEIFDYSIFKFGINQARKYLLEMENAFDLISNNRSLGNNRSQLGQSIKSFVFKSHIIFYEIEEDGILVLRVLHHSRDLKKLWE